MAKPKEDPHKARINSLFKDRRRDALGKVNTPKPKSGGVSTLLKARRDRIA